MKNMPIENKVFCPFCNTTISQPVGEHIRLAHGEQAFVQAVLDAKRAGMSDARIGERFGITFKQLEHLITSTCGVNISALPRRKQIKIWMPANFRPESTTVWSFKQRGNWATHDGSYRGNWSPYIPRNLILRYTKPGEVVLDPFVGGGTTAVEAKLLGRRCIARDINPACVELTVQNLCFNLPRTLFEETSTFEPEVSVGDARQLRGITDNSIDLICAHPPYASIISYTHSIEGDLSQLSIPEFLREMSRVAAECYRVLKPSGKCAVLIGDTRQRKHVVPIGFKTIEVFLQAGFHLRELIIKRQHNCKTTGFWAERSIKHNFLLLAHEYLPVFEKPERVNTKAEKTTPVVINASSIDRPLESARNVASLEATTVWAFPSDELEKSLAANIARRYGETIIRISESSMNIAPTNYTDEILAIVENILQTAKPGEFIVVQTKDVRKGNYVVPFAKMVVDVLEKHPCLWLKEIIIVAPSDLPAGLPSEESLHIVHQYLLVYEVVACGRSGVG